MLTASKLAPKISVNSRTGNEGGTSVTVKVIKLVARVPYDPILSNVISIIPEWAVRTNLFTMQANVEQAWIGN